MINQFESMSQSMGMIRSLGALTIIGTEKFIKRQAELTEAMVVRYNQQMKKAYADVGSAQSPQEWSQAVQKGLSNAVEAARECMLATSELQTESLRLMQEQAAEVQKAMLNGLNDVASPSGTSSREKSTKAK
jgi:hypothetical protein